MDEVKLKPCPFCGGKAEIAFSGAKYINGTWKGYIVCRCVSCTASVRGPYYAGVEIESPLEETIGAYTAKDRWNRRVNDGND